MDSSSPDSDPDAIDVDGDLEAAEEDASAEEPPIDAENEAVIIDGEEIGAEVPEEEPEAEPVYRRRFFSELQRQLNYSLIALALMAIPIGILAAYGTIGFRKAFFLLGNLFETESALDVNIQKILILVTGGLIFGWVLYRLKWDRFRTPAHVIVAATEREGRIPLKDGIITAVADALCLGMGVPVGRYGPAIQLGATIGSNIAQFFGLGKISIKVLLGCGVAAAISAAFNAPIAGVIFAHEVILGHFRLRAFAPITLASVAAVAVTRYHDVEYTALKLFDQHRSIDIFDYPVYILIGAVAAGLAMLYMGGIIRTGWLAQKSRIPLILQPACGALIAGLLAIGMPEILGLGDETIQSFLEQDKSRPQYAVGALVLLGLCKLLASVACLGFRMPGGSFSPAIFVGSALGAIAGLLIPTVDYQIAVLVGMAALVSSVMGAPLATILIVFELTENYQAATAVMVGVVAANALVTRFFARSLFHRQILMWGFDISRPDEQRIMQSKRVSEIMGMKYLAVRPERTVAELRKLVDHGYRSELFVIDEDRKLLGQLPLSELAIAEVDVTAGELCSEPETWLRETDSAWSGFEHLENFEGISVPVVNNEEEMTLVGAVYASDFLKNYKAAIDESRRSNS